MPFSSLLNKTADVQVKSFFTEANGERTETWLALDTHPTRLTKNGSAKVVEGVYKVTTDDFLFFFDPGVDIEREYRIVCDGLTYNVIAVYRANDSDNEHHVQVYAGRQDNG